MCEGLLKQGSGLLKRRGVHSPFECKVVDEQVGCVCVCVRVGGPTVSFEKRKTC